MSIALDTNILAYAEGVNGDERRALTRSLLFIYPEPILIPAQALAELFFVLTRKARRTPEQARQSVSHWTAAASVQDTSEAVLAEAMELVVSHQISWWDAVILAASVQGGAKTLWSEDMHDGFVWRGLTVKNPYKN